MAFIKLLEYETELLAELMEEDALVIMAKGLGIDRIIFKAVQPFCCPESLVFVLNMTDQEQLFMSEELSAVGVQHLPSIITGETLSADRERLYLAGGVFFISSRILVVDMLAKRVPIDYITGIFVHRAHKIGESSQEAFVLRMFREGNGDGFIKGLSDTPSAFMTGFAHVERVMKQLFVGRLFLWPRFHMKVNDCLENDKPDVVELSVQLTPLMSNIQLSVLDLISSCLRELKKAAPGIIDDQLLLLDNALVTSYDKTLHAQLEPHWNQLNKKTKTLAADLKVLRTILAYLTQYDCVTFFDFIESLRLTQTSSSRDSIWMLLDASNTVFGNAKARVHGTEKTGKNGKKTVEEGLESSPKWEALKQILKEIEDEEEGGDTGKVLVCASDERTCRQLRQILCEGAESLLKFLAEKSGNDRREGDKNKKGESAMAGWKRKRDEAGRVFSVDSIDDRFSVNVLPDSAVVIQPLSGFTDHYSLLRKLYELEPKYVILYDAKMEFVRQLEVFKASRPGFPLRVYFLFYESSVEEQRYLTTLRKENEAFEVLIGQKANMIVPRERTGKGAIAAGMIRDKIKLPDLSTRASGGRETESKNKLVIVDMREFRSDLPSIIHKRGMEIEPVTLEVGDYILTPEICVERKSISDLIGSLNNGRLYTQCVAMTRFYRKAILLIEFDETKSFSLQAQQSLKDEVSLQNTSSKLTLLTIHFPQLRIIWSQSPHLTAEIFEELKAGSKEPDSRVAITIGVDHDESSNYMQFNMVPQDIVLKFPGITSKNYRKVLMKYGSLKELVNASEEDIALTLEHKDFAKKFCEFVNKDKEEIPLHFKKKKDKKD